ncbi:hypothetical protein H6G20_09780 [Desertifilum sp. FACHB-1129]|uniref:Uncharacterized protein n=2 Tax=Desertifilum tharense IPPAS B-1220 TaxID=1781255 RepID=A0A1E5QLW7_9CYAN|nr:MULTISPECIES: hypothetical protein [Desertifilum]MDA0211717.1 hypothetical protein [Cyanobacteria bacterium FC1]MBD2311947.1 hypothetical protein [Desertifilum sp. FACHB-1129]MBD2322399.1 hypothetical protein [Desertifilum sp. FACHB-866]MBD2332562.1 hypothetical protein [Desertifilum sp. FACHB-868]OEJ75353.1 hypothetical protein BH720_10175 [Desertifilum tharense IPPAS B-1220]
MKAIEAIGRIDEHGQIVLDRALEVTNFDRVRVLVLFPDSVADSDPPDLQLEETQTEMEMDIERSDRADKQRPNPLDDLWERIEEEV